jgi:addiction module RelE/StbE family toxin
LIKEATEYNFVITKSYKKDLIKFKSTVKNATQKLEDIFKYLREGKMPPKETNRPHKIEVGKRLSHIPGDIWDIHVGSANSNWILLIGKDDSTRTIYLIAVGSHSQLDNLMHT